MRKLRILSTAMVILGFLAFAGGIAMRVKELMEFGLFIGIAGIIVYAIIYLMGSTSMAEHESTTK